MKKKNYKITTLLIVATLSVATLTGCGEKATTANKAITSQNGNSVATRRNIETLEGGIESTINNVQFSIDGNLFRLPFNFAELADRGYDVLALEGNRLAPDSKQDNIEVINSSVKALVGIKNTGTTEIDYKTGVIYKFSVYPTNFWDASSPNVGLVGGIELGMTTMPDVISLYGAPAITEFDKNHTATLIEYNSFQDAEGADKYNIKLWFDEITEVLVGVEMSADLEIN